MPTLEVRPYLYEKTGERDTHIHGRFMVKRKLRTLFFVGDCVAGALTAMAVTVVVRLLVWPGLDMVGAMIIGMLAGAVVHLVVGVSLSPMLGMFETMVSGMFIGMYGGMLFGMRDSMQVIPLGTALTVAAIFGVLVVFLVEFWNRQLRQQSAERGVK